MKRTIIGSLLALLPAAAQAEYRTVTWFADHPSEMRGVLRLCRDNAGLAGHNPNCINAEEAGTIVVQRELNARAAGGSPLDPGYWRSRPTERATQIYHCSLMAKGHALVPGDMSSRMCQAAQAAN